MQYANPVKLVVFQTEDMHRSVTRATSKWKVTVFSAKDQGNGGLHYQIPCRNLKPQNINLRASNRAPLPKYV
jgi:hypothetical protein